MSLQLSKTSLPMNDMLQRSMPFQYSSHLEAKVSGGGAGCGGPISERFTNSENLSSQSSSSIQYFSDQCDRASGVVSFKWQSSDFTQGRKIQFETEKKRGH